MRRLSRLLAKQPTLTAQGFHNTAQGCECAPWARRQPPPGSTRNGLHKVGPALCNPCGVGSGLDGLASFPGCAAATLGCAVQPLRGEYSMQVFPSTKTISEAWIPGNHAKD